MKRKVWSNVLAFVLTAFLAACGGGGGSSPATSGSTTISGVAAAGAPMIGFAYLKDSLDNELGPVTIGSDGSFSFDLTKLPANSAAPYYLQAQGAAGGQSFVLHSVTTSSGTANINPLTNLIVAEASGGKDPATVFANPSSVTGVNQASITAAITAMQTSLAPLLTAASVSATVNPITVGYVADPAANKLDALFDAVSIAVSSTSGANATVSVTDKSGGAILPSTSVTSTPSTIASQISSSATTAVTQTMTDSQGIVTFLQNFGNTVNSKGANLVVADMSPYYYGDDSSFGLDEGFTRTETIQELVSDLTGKIIQARGQVTKVGDFAIVNDVTANFAGFNKVYKIKANFYFQDGSYGSPRPLMTVAQHLSGGAWQFIGDKSMIDAEISDYANQGLMADGSATYRTGLYVYLEDVGNQGVNSASLEGPGLPTGGITFSKQATGNSSDTRLALDTSFQGQQLNDSWQQYEMTDTQIGQVVTGIAGLGQYTLKYYSGATVPGDHTSGLLQTRHPIMAAAPVTNATFSIGAANPSSTVQGWFPSANMTGFSGHSLSSFMSFMMGMTSMPFTYTLPTAYAPAWMSASVNLWDNSTDNQFENMELALNKTGSSFTVVKPSFTPTGGYLGVESQDSAQRRFTTVWVLQ